jgi:GNAT superfamily N-acetyltransferase
VAAVPLTIEPCSLADYGQVLADLTDFWGSDRTRAPHHPVYVREFGNSAFVVRDGGVVAAYLFGFLSQTEPAGYVHLVAVRRAYRRQGLAALLYRHFIDFARGRGCRAIKAITTPGNSHSVAFHAALGMRMEGEPNAEGVRVVKDYSGPGEERVVFRMMIGPEGRGEG